MSGFHGRHFTFDDQGRYEEQWAHDALMMNNGEQQQQDLRATPTEAMEEETPPPGLMHSARTDSINSTTVFVNPNDIQPQFGGQTLESAEGLQQQLPKSPQKRRLPQQEATYEILVSSDGRQREEVISLNVPVSHNNQVIHDNNQMMNDNNQVIHDNNQVINDQMNMTHNQVMKQEGGGYSGSIEPPSPGNQDSRFSWTSELSTQSNIGQPPSPTGLDPSTTNWLGQYHFDVNFTQLSLNTKNKHWDYSKQLQKLFIDMNKFVQVEFNVGPNPPEGLYIRALPVYATTTHSRLPVKRCPNHASPNDPTNVGFHHTQHLIRFQDDNAMYVEDSGSNRLSVLYRVEAPHQGTSVSTKMMKFMCLGSDVGGINRKPLKVVFTLEAGVGQVVGRKVVDVRICSCPKRDMQQEEERLERQANQAKAVAMRLADSTIVMGPPPKKRKKEKGEEIIMIPVAADDFKKMNEFAEAAMIVRNPEKADEIKETRRRLLQQHNAELIQSLGKKK